MCASATSLRTIRRAVTSIAPSTGRRVVRILVSDGGKSMLDLSTVRLSFDIVNNETTGDKKLFLPSHLGCLFQRLTLRIAGTQCEDLSLIHI